VRLDDLKEKFGDLIKIEWKSFMLRPTEAGRKTREEFIEYTRNWARMTEVDPRLEATSPWASGDPSPSHSLPALAAAKLVKTYGDAVEDDFHHRMFKAYFSQNRTISDLAVITSIAAEAGLDPVEFAAAFEAQQDTLANLVIADHNEAQQIGISGVPATIVNNEVLVSGAQPTEAFVGLIEERLS
jgi:predicted DsbA family dithiol-disulfide isomerase